MWMSRKQQQRELVAEATRFLRAADRRERAAAERVVSAEVYHADEYDHLAVH
jgi:hypothetical protein